MRGQGEIFLHWCLVRKIEFSPISLCSATENYYLSIVKIDGDYQCKCTCVCCVWVSWWNVATIRSSATGVFFARQWILKQMFPSKSLHWSLRTVHSAAVLSLHQFVLVAFHLLLSLLSPSSQPHRLCQSNRGLKLATEAILLNQPAKRFEGLTSWQSGWAWAAAADSILTLSSSSFSKSHKNLWCNSDHSNVWSFKLPYQSWWKVSCHRGVSKLDRSISNLDHDDCTGDISVFSFRYQRWLKQLGIVEWRHLNGNIRLAWIELDILGDRIGKGDFSYEIACNITSVEDVPVTDGVGWLREPGLYRTGFHPSRVQRSVYWSDLTLVEENTRKVRADRFEKSTRRKENARKNKWVRPPSDRTISVVHRHLSTGYRLNTAFLLPSSRFL